MAFGGAPANTAVLPAATGAKLCTNAGGTLTAYAGDATDITQTSVGQFTTGAPGGSQNQLLATFGPGAGNWAIADLAFVRVEISDASTEQQGGIGQVGKFLVDTQIAGGPPGNLTVRVSNLGNKVTGALTFRFHYLR